MCVQHIPSPIEASSTKVGERITLIMYQTAADYDSSFSLHTGGAHVHRAPG